MAPEGEKMAPEGEKMASEGEKASSDQGASEEKAPPKKGSEMTADEKKQAVAAAKKKAQVMKMEPQVREGRPVAGGVVAPRGTKFNKEEIIGRALEKIRATQAHEQAAVTTPEVTRRELFATTGWAGFTAFVAFLGGCFGRFFFPRVLFEPPTRFKAGSPREYAVGEVSAKYKESNRVWIVREGTGFYAVFARCTHLGCTPSWLDSEQKFKCPCHGSGFTKEAINYEGPAPRPMERCFITLADDGQILIDTNQRYLYQGPSGRSWEDQGAYLYA